jgi:hypothetical protein
MSAERRDNACCNEHKFVSRDSKFPWCLSCCFWYAIVLQDESRYVYRMVYLVTGVSRGGIIVMGSCMAKSGCCNLSPLPYILVLASFPYYIRQRGCFPAFVLTNASHKCITSSLLQYKGSSSTKIIKL